MTCGSASPLPGPRKLRHQFPLVPSRKQRRPRPLTVSIAVRRRTSLVEQSNKKLLAATFRRLITRYSCPLYLLAVNPSWVHRARTIRMERLGLQQTRRTPAFETGCNCRSAGYPLARTDTPHSSASFCPPARSPSYLTFRLRPYPRRKPHCSTDTGATSLQTTELS